jgi:hypothetical protein
VSMDNGSMDNGPMDRPKQAAAVGGPVGGPSVAWLEEGEEGPKEVAEVVEVAKRVVRSIGVNALND